MVSVMERGVAMKALVMGGGATREVEVEEEVLAAPLLARASAAATFWEK
jgi:hypothetical protein